MSSNERDKIKRAWRLFVAVFKGGSTKTTTAILMAIAWAQAGERVLVICADTTNRGAAKWTSKALERGYELPYIFVEWSPELGPLSKFAKQQETKYGATIVIIDAGGEKAETFTHGCLYADFLIVPIAPHEGEMEAIGNTYLNAAAVSDSGADLVMAVLLTRSPQPGKGMSRKYRAELQVDLRDEDGMPNGSESWSVGAHVFDTEITRSAAYTDMHGHIPDDVGEYAKFRDELIEIRQKLEEAA